MGRSAKVWDWLFKGIHMRQVWWHHVHILLVLLNLWFDVLDVGLQFLVLQLLLLILDYLHQALHVLQVLRKEPIFVVHLVCHIVLVSEYIILRAVWEDPFRSRILWEVFTHSILAHQTTKMAASKHHASRWKFICSCLLGEEGVAQCCHLCVFLQLSLAKHERILAKAKVNLLDISLLLLTHCLV